MAVQVNRVIGHAHPFGLTVAVLRFQSLEICRYYFRPVVGQVQIELGQIPGPAAASVQDHPFAGGFEQLAVILIFTGELSCGR